MLKISKAVRRRLEKPYWTEFWGQRCMCRPKFVEAALGDGYQLIYITPLNTRPHYYLIRVHSSWSISSHDENCIADHLDEIYDAIENEYLSTDIDGCSDEPWPALSLDSGCAWGDAMDELGLSPKRWHPEGWIGLRTLASGLATGTV